jgi:hypothetical protein
VTGFTKCKWSRIREASLPTPVVAQISKTKGNPETSCSLLSHVNLNLPHAEHQADLCPVTDV